MSSKYITAWTPSGYPIYPPYINISFVDDHTVRLSIRGEPSEYLSGKYATIDIPRDIAVQMFDDALFKLNDND